MPTSTLTVNLQSEEIEFFQKYAQRHGLTADEVVTQYLQRLKCGPQPSIHAEVAALAELVPPDLESNAEYHWHLLNKHRCMIADIRKLVPAVPFVPFTIHLADGGHLRVPTVDRAAVSPTGGRVIVFADDDTHDILSGLLISRVTVDRHPGSRTKL